MVGPRLVAIRFFHSPRSLFSSRPPEPDTTNSRPSHFRCGPCIRTRCRRLLPFPSRHSVHAPDSLGWARRHLRIAARQVCSDLRGGSRATNQYHSSVNVFANVTDTKETVTGANGRGLNSLRGSVTDRSSKPRSSSRSQVKS